MGCIGLVAYNARRVAPAAGLPMGTTAFNVNRLCGSGLPAIVSGAMQLQVGQSDVVVSGGNENMTRLPYLVPEARVGHRLGDRTMVDGTLAILTDPWINAPMGATAENVAREHSVSRADQDARAASPRSPRTSTPDRTPPLSHLLGSDLPSRRTARSQQATHPASMTVPPRSCSCARTTPSRRAASRSLAWSTGLVRPWIRR